MFRALELVARNRIEAVIQRGEFDDLPGRGRRHSFDDERHIPEDRRMVQRLVENAGFVPEGVALRQRVLRQRVLRQRVLRQRVAAFDEHIRAESLAPDEKSDAYQRLSLLRVRLECLC